MLRFRLALSLALLFGSTSIALAQPSEKEQAKGRELATVALDLYQKEKFADALGKFQEAEKLYPTAQVLRMEGYTLIALKRFVEAADVLDRALKTTFKPLLPADAEDTEDQLKEALKKIATVTIPSMTKDATVRIDDGEPKEPPYTLRLLPGAHRFVVEAPGHETLDVTKDVAAGESTLHLALQPTKPAPPPAPKLVEPEPEKPGNGWFPHQFAVGSAVAGVGIAAGGAALGMGLYGLSLEKAVQTNIDIHRQNYDARCTTNTALCQEDAALIERDGKRAALFRNAGLVTGLAGVGLTAVGGLLIGFAPSASSKDSAAPQAKPSALRLDVGCGIAGLGATCSGTF